MGALVILVAIVSASLPRFDPQAPAASVTERNLQVTGRVIDLDGKPIADAVVDLFETCNRDPIAPIDPSGRTGVDGKFALSWKVPPESVDVAVRMSAPRRMTSFVGSAGFTWLQFSNAKPVIVDLGDVILPAGASLSGVVRERGGAPMPGVRVTALDALDGLALSYGSARQASRQFVLATSDAQGRFDLRGVAPDGVSLTFAVDGYFEERVPFATVGDPLRIELTPSGFVSGKVVDAGHPCKAAVWVEYEVGDESLTDVAETDADGLFRLFLRHPHRFQVRARVKSSGQFCFGDILDGPATGLTIRAATQVLSRDERRLVIRPLDAATGKAIDNANAFVEWGADASQVGEKALDPVFPGSPPLERRPGQILLPGPSAGQPNKGVVVVGAPGHAPCLVADVQWFDDKPVFVEAKMLDESVITGTVCDAAGKPVAGAALRFGDPEPELDAWEICGADAMSRNRATDDGGRFRIDCLAAGQYRLHARLADGPCSITQIVSLGTGEHRDVKFTLPKGVTLAGRLLVPVAVAGSKLQLRRKREPRPLIGEWDLAGDRESALASGGFEFHCLEPGEYGIDLLVPRRSGRCGWLRLPVGPVHVGQSDLRRDLDLTKVAPGRVRGTVKLCGVALSPGRTVVLAYGADEGAADLAGGVCPHACEVVASDGSFTITLSPGEHRLELLDLATRVPLAAKAGIRIKQGAVSTVDFTAELVQVHIELRPQEPDGSVVAAHLGLTMLHELNDGVFGRISVDEVRVGAVSLAGNTVFDLLLPSVPTKLSVRSHIDSLISKEWNEAQSLAECEFTPQLRTADRVHIEVPPQPKAGKGR